MVVYWIHLPNVGIEKNGYVGISTNVKQRWAKHKSLVSGSHRLKNAIQKYGTALVWEVIFEGSEEDCIALEEIYRPMPDTGWNIRSGGNYYKLSEETKEKVRAANIGKVYSEATREKHRARMLGNKHAEGSGTNRIVTQETRDKIGAAHKGKIISDSMKEHLRKINTGKKLSVETRLKISEAGKRRVCSEATKEKLRNRVISEATKEKQMAANQNRVGKGVVCEELNLEFVSCVKASEYLGVNKYSVAKSIRKWCKCGGYTWSYKSVGGVDESK